jgi:hypothetical protein
MLLAFCGCHCLPLAGPGSGIQCVTCSIVGTSGSPDGYVVPPGHHVTGTLTAVWHLPHHQHPLHSWPSFVNRYPPLPRSSTSPAASASSSERSTAARHWVTLAQQTVPRCRAHFITHPAHAVRAVLPARWAISSSVTIYGRMEALAPTQAARRLGNPISLGNPVHHRAAAVEPAAKSSTIVSDASCPASCRSRSRYYGAFAVPDDAASVSHAVPLVDTSNASRR